MLYINLLFIIASLKRNSREEVTKIDIRYTFRVDTYLKIDIPTIDKMSRITLDSRPQYILLKKNIELDQKLETCIKLPIAKDEADTPPDP